jgi:hypothetical protein
MLDRLDGQVDIEIRPVEVSRTRPLEPKYGLDRSALEPREVFEGKEQLVIVQQQPEPMLGDVRDLNL